MVTISNIFPEIKLRRNRQDLRYILAAVLRTSRNKASPIQRRMI